MPGPPSKLPSDSCTISQLARSSTLEVAPPAGASGSASRAYFCTHFLPTLTCMAARLVCWRKSELRKLDDGMLAGPNRTWSARPAQDCPAAAAAASGGGVRAEVVDAYSARDG